MSDTNDRHRLLSAAEVADRLGIARSTVYQRVRYGHLTPLSQLPGRTGALLFDADEIDRAAAAQREAAKRGALS